MLLIAMVVVDAAIPVGHHHEYILFVVVVVVAVARLAAVVQFTSCVLYVLLSYLAMTLGMGMPYSGTRAERMPGSMSSVLSAGMEEI